MRCKDLLLGQMASSQWLFDEFSKDFLEQDAKFQPCPGGINLNWMLLHLAVTEDTMVSKLSGTPTKLPEKLHTTYGSGSPCDVNDAMTLMDAKRIFAETRARAIEFVKTFDEAKYDRPAPAGLPPMFKTVGDYISLLGIHPFWHFGQLTVNRRMMKKPPIFSM